LHGTILSHKNFDEIALMVIYSGEGTVMRHFIPGHIGKNMVDVDVEVGDGRPLLLQSIKEVNDITRFTIILAVSALIVAAIVMYFILHVTTKPIVNVTDNLKEISEGEWDLTKRLNVNSKDEIGDLSKYFNHTLEAIGALIKRIKYKVNALTNTGHEFSANMTKTSHSVDDISANFYGIFQRGTLTLWGY
jgi:methyl-accepting chemotaxis protein